MKKTLLGAGFIAASLFTGCGGSCGSDSPAADVVDTTTPEAQIMSMVGAVKSNNVKAIFDVCPCDKDARAKFEEGKKSMSDQDKAQFNMTLGMLLADGAEDNLFAMASAQMTQVEDLEKTAQGIEMMGGMMVVPAATKAGIPQEKAMAIVKGLAEWVKASNVNDKAALKAAIGKLVAGVKKLEIKNADDLQKLSFDQALVKAGIALGTVKEMLSVYKIDVDSFLSTVSATSTGGDKPKVTIKGTLFGQEITAPAFEAIKVDGTWKPAGCDSKKACCPINGSTPSKKDCCPKTK